jgi:mono/diheme cytochrome c family protein
MRRGRSIRLAVAAALAMALGLASAADPAAAGAGDPVRGQDLFTGTTPFRNGGAPCGACHAIGGQRAAFAAALGPELSASFAGMAPEDMDGILAALPFPTMEPLYAGRALEPAERADLAAFLSQAAGTPPPGAGQFVAWSALVTAACLVAVAWASRRRRGSLREELRAKALPTHGRSR